MGWGNDQPNMVRLKRDAAKAKQLAADNVRLTEMLATQALTIEAAQRLVSMWNESPKTRTVLRVTHPGLAWAIDHLREALWPGIALPEEPLPNSKPSPSNSDVLELP